VYFDVDALDERVASSEYRYSAGNAMGIVAVVVVLRKSNAVQLPVHKWNFDDSFPILFLPVENEFKVQREKVKDWRIRIVHQILLKKNVKGLIETSTEISYMISAENLVFAR